MTAADWWRIPSFLPHCVSWDCCLLLTLKSWMYVANRCIVSKHRWTLCMVLRFIHSLLCAALSSIQAHVMMEAMAARLHFAVFKKLIQEVITNLGWLDIFFLVYTDAFSLLLLESPRPGWLRIYVHIAQCILTKYCGCSLYYHISWQDGEAVFLLEEYIFTKQN